MLSSKTKKGVVMRTFNVSELKITEVNLLSAEEAFKISMRKDKEILKADRNWWLRSPGIQSDYASCINGENGSPYSYGAGVASSLGVRPALRITNLKELKLRVGAKFACEGISFTVVLADTALSDEIVGECSFNTSCEDGNSYAASNVKKYVRVWAKDHRLISGYAPGFMGFCEEVCEKVSQSLPEGYSSPSICEKTMNGGVKAYGVTSRKEGAMVSPVIYLEPYYADYQDEKNKPASDRAGRCRDHNNG